MNTNFSDREVDAILDSQQGSLNGLQGMLAGIVAMYVDQKLHPETYDVPMDDAREKMLLERMEKILKRIDKAHNLPISD